MAKEIYIKYYGETRDDVNTAEYAAKVASGLRRLADTIEDPTNTFVTEREFAAAAENNTQIHLSMVTEPSIKGTEDNMTVQILPRAQFNIHVLMKHVVSEEDFAGDLSGTEALEPS